MYKTFDVRRIRSTVRYRRFQRGILLREPLCRPCRIAGLTVGAEEMDHIVPVHKAPGRFWDPENVQPICTNCHKTKTANENRTAEHSEHKTWRAQMGNWQ